MKYVVVLAVVAVLMALLAVDAKPIYRGVATDVWAGGCSDLQALDRMSWYWNYKVKPNAGDDSCDLGGRYLEFVPMIWGRSQAEQTNLATEIPAGTTHLMAFNEPQIAGQSDLTPSEAATLWKGVIAQLDAAGRTSSIKFGAPSASPGGSDPIVWLQDFFTACDGCRFDFITVHNYDCNSPYFNGDSTMYWVNLYNVTFGKPIWLTEFACPGQVSEANELQYMNDLLTKLDNAPYVERYSWFTARATNVGTIPSLFTATPGQLTNVGILYNSKGDIINPSGSTTGSDGGNDGSNSNNSNNNNNGNNSGASSLSSVFLDTLKSL